MTTTAVGSGSWGVRAGHIAPAANVYHPARAPLTTFTPLPSRKICSSSALRDDHWRHLSFELSESLLEHGPNSVSLRTPFACLRSV